MAHLTILLVTLAIFSANTLCLPLDCSRPNEEYQCGSACQTTCHTLGQLCPIINIICTESCYCKEGYARVSNDKNSSCVPVNECPQIKDNE